MARVLFVRWDGRGNVPPAFGVAQALMEPGHEVVVAGQELAEPPERVVAEGHTTFRERCEARGFPFALLERSSAAWAERPPEPRIVAGMMACPAHIADVSELLFAESPDVVIVNCLMFGALAAVEDVATPVAALVPSAPRLHGSRWAEGAVLAPARERTPHPSGADAGWSPLGHLDPRAAICTTTPEVDPLAAMAPASFEYVGPVFDRLPTGWQPPWGSDDDRPLVLISFASTSAWDRGAAGPG